MKSHTYDFKPAQAIWLFTRPLGVVLLFAAVMHLGASLHLLPASRPTLDADRTILIHQAESARKTTAAEVLLLGDSSCLMDVSARRAGEQLGRKVLNLGSLSYLDLPAYAAMLRQYVTTNPGKLRAIVLLMHPEALRRSGAEASYTEFLQKTFEGAAPDHLGVTSSQFNSFAGVNIFRSRLLSRWLPTPLPGEFGRRYGFSADLEKFMDENDGSILEPKSERFQGSAEYWLAPQLESASHAFKAAVPKDVKIFVAITPLPASFARPGYATLHAQILQQWSQWLEAQPLQLPATLPDNFFAKTTHLNESGVTVYTALLTQNLKAHLP